MMKNSLIIEEYLDHLFPNPHCELNYNNDYELLIAIMLSAQTTDKMVNSVTAILFKKYPTLNDLKNADLADLESILRPIGFRKKALYVKNISTILCDNYQGKVPIDRKILETFPGVGRKTVNVFFSEFCDIPAIAVDTHVNRVSKRLKLARKADTIDDVEKKLMKAFKKNVWGKRHLQLVLFGRYYCKAIKPLCSECQLKDICREKNKNL